MEKIDVQHFKKYYNNNEDATLARVGHVNAVIQELNNLAPEVAITAGQNITVAGEGTPESPFVISALGGGYKDLGDSSAVTDIDWSEAATQELNLDNNPTLTFANAQAGANLSLLLKSGLTQRSVNWPNDVLWNRGVAPTIAALPQSGGIDPLFLSGTGFTVAGMGGSPQANMQIGTSYVLSTGKILVWNAANSSASYNGTLLPGNTSMSGKKDLVRLNADGTIDSTWASNTWSSFQKGVGCIFELSDGRILVGGDFDNGGNISTNGNAALQLLSANGVRDNSFLPTFTGGGMGTVVNSIVQQSTGKVIVAGDFGAVNGLTHQEIVRFNSDLTLDSTFTAAIGTYMFTVMVYALALDDSDSIFVGGSFSGVPINGSGTYYNLVKLDADGNISPFNYGSGINGPVSSLKIDSLNRLVIGGGFNDYNGSSIGYGITRLLFDGTLDTSFVTGTGGNAGIDYLLILPDDKIVALNAYISTFNGTAVSRLFVLSATGAIDTEVVIPSTGLSGTAPYSYYGLTLQNTGDILVTGPFNAYGGATANAIVSINISTATEVYTEIDFKHNGVNYIGSFK